MADDDKPTFTQEDLSHISSDDGGDKGAAAAAADKGAADAGAGGKGAAAGAGKGDAGDKGAASDGKGAEGAAAGDGKGGEAAAGAKGGAGKGDKVSIATGAEPADKAAATDEAKAAARAEEIKAFREQLAKHASAGDKKAYDKELRRLERLGIERPEQVYGLYRELDNRLNGGGLVKVPGKDAKPEEIEAYRKAVGMPDKPEGFLEKVELANGAVIGQADKESVGKFLEAVHGANSPQEFVNKALDWYYKGQEDAAAALDQADDTFKRESHAALKEEWGAGFKRKLNAVGSLFATAEGGADADNPNSLFAQILHGRTMDGRIIGDHPAILRLLSAWAEEINPAMSVVEDGAQSGMSMDAEIEKIEGIMRENRKLYNEKYATRYGELLAAKNKIQERARARA